MARNQQDLNFTPGAEYSCAFTVNISGVGNTSAGDTVVVSATDDDSTVTTDGPITSSTISDPGLTHESVFHGIPEVPALGGAQTVALGVFLLTGALVALRRR